MTPATANLIVRNAGPSPTDARLIADASATNYLSLAAEILDANRAQVETACYLVTFGGGRKSPEICQTRFRETVSDDGRRLLT